ncbi:unnamed protein product [Camellia sinensis]
MKPLIRSSKRKALKFTYPPLPLPPTRTKVEEPPPAQKIPAVIVEPTSDTAPKPLDMETYISEELGIVKEIAPKSEEKSPGSVVVEKEIVEIAKIQITDAPLKEVLIWGVLLFMNNRTDVILLKFL